nr:hypothetical protein [Tanacetum cinerariifolium]
MASRLLPSWFLDSNLFLGTLLAFLDLLRTPFNIKALNEGYSSKNYVRKSLRAQHPKWRAKVAATEESKDLTSPSLDELIKNPKVHEMIIKKDLEIVKAKGERRSLALKAKKESSDEECLIFESEDKEKCFRCRDLNHLIGECPKPSRDKNERAFIGGSWSDNGEEDDEKVNDETCLMAQASNEIYLGVDLEPDEWIKDNGCSKHMTGNRKLFSTYKAYNGGNVIFGSNLRGCTIVSIRIDHGREFDNEVQFGEFCNANGITHNFSALHTPQSNVMVERKTPYELLKGRKPTLDYFRVFGSKCFILNTKDYLTKFDPKSYESVFLGYSQNSKGYIILNKHTRKIEESLNMTFDETPPSFKTSPLVDNNLDEEEAIKVNDRKNLKNDIEDETLEIDEIVNIKKSRNHPLEKCHRKP